MAHRQRRQAYMVLVCVCSRTANAWPVAETTPAPATRPTPARGPESARMRAVSLKTARRRSLRRRAAWGRCAACVAGPQSGAGDARGAFRRQAGGPRSLHQAGLFWSQFFVRALQGLAEGCKPVLSRTLPRRNPRFSSHSKQSKPKLVAFFYLLRRTGSFRLEM